MPCIAVDAATGEVLMLAWVNAAALAETLSTGTAHYWSRSRGRLWRKGETSGAVQRIVEVRTDCDQDAILYRVEVARRDAICHTGRTT
jgi:phosphoribosyl-AMP cyclohydrolase